MLSSAHILAMDAKNLLDVIDSIRINYPGVDQVIATHAQVRSSSALTGSGSPARTRSSVSTSSGSASSSAASSLENPVLGVVREDPSGGIEQIDWTLSWQLPDTGRRPEIAAREAAAGAAAARLQQQLLALRLTMKEAYADWAFASARHGRLAARAERIEVLAGREHLRAGRGEASGLEARRLDLAAGSLRARVALAAAAAEQARATAAGWSPALPPDARPVVPALPVAPELQRDHPLVRAAQRDLAAATLEREAAGRLVRSPEISLGWQRQGDGPESIEGPVLGLAWSVPVFARNRAEIAASEARISAARGRLEVARRQLESARAGARESFLLLATALGEAEAAAAGNQLMLDGAEAAFRHGEASLTDLLETHRSITESELAVLDLHQAALAAYRELGRVAGRRPRETSPTIDPNH